MQIKKNALQKYTILFVINPISGGKKKLSLPAVIEANLDRHKFSASFSFTNVAGHATKIAQDAISKNIDIIVAVGGDGTINEIAQQLLGTDKILGIIPLGSGNGLARALHIPMNTKKAIAVINKLDTKLIDAAKLNQKYFFNMAGIGFDAHVSAVFAGSKTRGLKGYLKMGLKEVLSYRPKKYELNIDGKIYEREAFVISIANSTQYGNNFHISPNSSLTDGFLEICIVKPLPLYKLLFLALQMMCSTTHRSKMVEIISGQHIQIKREAAAVVHLDGEPVEMDNFIEIDIIPLALKIITN